MSQFLWSQRQDIGPSPRGGHALAYDAQRKRTVLFGGLGPSGALADTWEWDGSFWTQVADTGPSARWMHGLAYDGTRAILFGGATPNGQDPSIVHADTWAWDGEHWTQLADTGPAARAAAPLVHSSSGDEVILFGGWSPTAFSADTWSFSGGNWTQVADTGPSPRAWHALGRGGDGGVILFGGSDSTASFGDTWAWDGGSWAQIQDIGAGARGAAAIGDGGVLFAGAAGGFRTPTALFADTWTFDGSLWTQVQDMGPSARWAAAAAVDTDRSRIVLFGGFTAASTTPESSAVADTWEASASAQTSSEALSFTDAGALSIRGDIGMVQFSLATPSATDAAVTVSVDGQQDPVASPSVPSGHTDGVALFSIGGAALGSHSITVHAGAAFGHTSISLVDAPALGAFRSEQPTTTVGGSVFLTLTVAQPEPVTRQVAVVAVEPGVDVFETITVAAGAQGDVTHDFALHPDVGKGLIHLVAVSTADGAMTVLGPAALQVS